LGRCDESGGCQEQQLRHEEARVARLRTHGAKIASCRTVIIAAA
jgi:hypothetical protein